MRSVSERVNSWLWLLPGVRREPPLNMLFNVWPHTTIFFFSRAWKRKKKSGGKGKKNTSTKWDIILMPSAGGRSSLLFLLPPFGSIISQMWQWQWVSDNIYLIHIVPDTGDTDNWDIYGPVGGGGWMPKWCWSLWQSNHRKSVITFFSIFLLSIQGQSDLFRLNQKSQGFKTVLKHFL